MRRIFAIIVLIAFLVSACAPGITPENTPTPGSGGGADPGAGGDAGASGDTGGAAVDVETGLTIPAFNPPPAGVTAPPAPTGSGATISIQGGLPLTLYGECTEIEGSLFVIAPPGSAVPPSIALVMEPGEGSARIGTLTWAVGGTAAESAGVTMLDPLRITLNSDNVSGSVEGNGFLGNFEPIAVSGEFNCTTPFVHVSGDHPADLVNARCSMEGGVFTIRGGSEHSVGLLRIEGAPTAGSTATGTLSWRVGGVDYVTLWLTVSIGSGGISGAFTGEAFAADGADFPISGTFNCLASS